MNAGVVEEMLVSPQEDLVHPMQAVTGVPLDAIVLVLHQDLLLQQAWVPVMVMVVGEYLAVLSLVVRWFVLWCCF